MNHEVYFYLKDPKQIDRAVFLHILPDIAVLNRNQDYIAMICDDEDQSEIRTAYIREVKHMRFSDILNSDLCLHYLEDCRTKAGLLAYLREVNETFDERQVIALIWFDNIGPVQ